MAVKVRTRAPEVWLPHRCGTTPGRNHTSGVFRAHTGVVPPLQAVGRTKRQ